MPTRRSGPSDLNASPAASALLSEAQFERLLRMSDGRTRQGNKRDLALLHLLGSAGLRRAEAAQPADHRRRRAQAGKRPAPACSDRPIDQLVGDGPLRQARPHPSDPTRRGRARRDHRLGQRPPAGRDRAPAARCRAPASRHDRSAPAISPGSSPATRRPPGCRRTVAPRTSCVTPSAPTSPIAAPTPRSSASSPGHADIRTTTIYTDVNPTRLKQAIAERSRQRQGVRRTGAHD
jgi:hypothetical protein